MNKPSKFSPHQIEWARRNPQRAKLTGVTAQAMLQHNYKVRTAELVAESLQNQNFYNDFLEASRESMKAFDDYVEGELRMVLDNSGLTVDDLALIYGPIDDEGGQEITVAEALPVSEGHLEIPILYIRRKMKTSWKDGNKLFHWDFSTELAEDNGRIHDTSDNPEP